jgi:hypothetical protein
MSNNASFVESLRPLMLRYDGGLTLMDMLINDPPEEVRAPYRLLCLTLFKGLGPWLLHHLRDNRA